MEDAGRWPLPIGQKKSRTVSLCVRSTQTVAMLSWGVIRFFFYLALPYIIGKTLNFLATRGNAAGKGASKSPQPHQRKPPSRFEIFSYSLACILIVNYMLLTYGGIAPQNFFEIIDCPCNAPTFLVREQYQKHLDRRAEESPLFKAIMEQLNNDADRVKLSEDDRHEVFKRHRNASMNPHLHYARWIFSGILKFNFVSPSSFIDEDVVSDEQLEFELLEFLFDKLKVPSRRTLYLRFGERAIIECTFGRDDMDFMMYIAPILSVSYLQFMLVVGLLTSITKKSKWRSIMILFICVLIVCESLYYFSPQEMDALQLFDTFFTDTGKYTNYQKLDMTRKLFFAFALALILLWDNGPKVSDLELLQHIHEKNEKVIARDQMLKLMRQAVFANGDLRKVYVDEAARASGAIVYHNPDFQRDTAAILDQYDLDKMHEMIEEEFSQVLTDSNIQNVSTTDEKRIHAD